MIYMLHCNNSIMHSNLW